MKSNLTSFLFALATGVVAFDSIAQPYPARPVRIVVPAAAGGTVDLLTRALARKLGDHLGQPLIVENRAAATTSVGEEHYWTCKDNVLSFPSMKSDIAGLFWTATDTH